MEKKCLEVLLFLTLFILTFLLPGNIFAEESSDNSISLPDDVKNYQLTAADKVLLAEINIIGEK
jgi:hypothetical protein